MGELNNMLKPWFLLCKVKVLQRQHTPNDNATMASISYTSGVSYWPKSLYGLISS